MKRSIIVVLLLAALQLMPVLMPSGMADAPTKDVGPGPMGKYSELVWQDDYLNFSKTVATEGPLNISNSKVLVGNATVAQGSDDHTVVLFHFEEGSGTIAVDSGPHKINGTLTNMDPATDWVPGISGKGLDFDGINDRVALPMSLFYVVKNVTTEAWVNSRYMQFFNDKVLLDMPSGYYLTDHEFCIETPTVQYARKVSILENRWLYLAGTYDGATVRFYINGLQVASLATAAGIADSTNYMYIGSAAYGNFPLNGTLDEVRVSDTARSAKEINDTWLTYQDQLKGYKAPHASLLTQKMTVPPNRDWDEINVVKSTPANTSIDITVLDNATRLPVFGYDNLTGPNIDLSGIDPKVHPAIQLRVDFTTDNTTVSPALDYINVTCIRPNTIPKMNEMKTDGSVRRPGSVPIYFNISDKEQLASTLDVSVQTAKYPNGTYNSTNLQDLHFDTKTGLWTVNFTALPTTESGPYSLKVKIVDDMSYSLTVIWEGKMKVFTDEGASVDLAPKDLSVLRGTEGQLSIVPHLNGALSDLNLSVSVLRSGVKMPWCTAPVLSGDHFVIKVRPPLNSAPGGYSVQILATDKVSYRFLNTTVKDGFFVKNNPPVWTARTYRMDEDAMASFDLSGNIVDVDTPSSNLSIGLLGNTLGSQASLEVTKGQLVVMSLPHDWAGSFNVSFNISDGIDRTVGNVTVKVDQIPDPPVIDNINDMSGFERTTLYYNFTASDPDPGTILQYSLDLGIAPEILSKVPGYSFDSYTGSLALPLTNDMVGDHACNLSVTDGQFVVKEPFGLTVINVNDPPSWSKVPSDTVRSQGQSFTFDVLATDIDKGDALTYSVTAVPSTDISMDASSGHMTFSPKTVGIFFINITASDGKAAIHHEFKMEIRRPGANSLPQSSLLGPANGATVDLVNPLFEWTVADPDSTNVTSNVYLGTDLYGVSHLDPRYLVGKDLTSKRFVPVQFLEQGKTYYWTVIPQDQSAYGSCKDGVWSLTVLGTARTNHPPVIEPLKTLTVTQGKSIKIDIKATDEDKDALTYTIVSGPSDAYVNSNGQISWKAGKPAMEPYLIKVAVSDGRYVTTTTAQITVRSAKGNSAVSTMAILAIVGIVVACVVVVVVFKVMSKKKTG